MTPRGLWLLLILPGTHMPQFGVLFVFAYRRPVYFASVLVVRKSVTLMERDRIGAASMHSPGVVGQQPTHDLLHHTTCAGSNHPPHSGLLFSGGCRQQPIAQDDVF